MTRSTSALTLEDTEFFTLSKQFFLESFGKNVYKAENERKNFLVKCFPCLKDVHRTKIDEIYRKLTIEMAARNQIIYIEKHKADHIFIILEGECRLEKSVFLQSDDIHSLNNKRIVLLKLGIGDFCGMEHAVSNELYDHFLISSSDFTALMKININLWPDFKNNISSYLRPIYEKRKLFLNTLLDEYKQKKLTINYKSFSQSKSKINLKRKEVEISKKVQDLIKEVQTKPRHFSKNLETNSFSDKKMFVNQKPISGTPNTSVLIYKKERVNTATTKELNRINHSVTGGTFRFDTYSAIKNHDTSTIEDDSFALCYNRPKSSKSLLARSAHRKKVVNIRNITQIDSNSEGLESKSRSFGNKVNSKKHQLKTKIVSKEVKHRLLEWRETKASNMFHSGNFELPLYTLSR